MFISLLKSCCTLLQSIDFEARNTQDGLSVPLRQFLPAVKVFADWMACHADLWQASSIRLLALLNICFKVNLFHVTWKFIRGARIAKRRVTNMARFTSQGWCYMNTLMWTEFVFSLQQPQFSPLLKNQDFQISNWRGTCAWTKALSHFLSNTKFFFWLSSIHKVLWKENKAFYQKSVTMKGFIPGISL